MTLDGVSPEAMAAYERFNELTGGLPVNSAYRSPEHNARVGGAKNSQHTHGNAFDFDVSGKTEAERIALINHARAAGFRGVGVYDNALHFDVGSERAWGPSYSADSLPDWYRNAFAGGAAPAAPQGASGGMDFNRLVTLMQAMPQWRNSLRG